VAALQPLRHALLSKIGVDHGFGLRGLVELAGLRRPRQVHGVAVVTAQQCAEQGSPPEADVVISEEIGTRIAVATADCLPILLAGDRGRVVAAAHAGWRGLAGGVISACLAALRERLEKSESVAAVIMLLRGGRAGAGCLCGAFFRNTPARFASNSSGSRAARSRPAGA